MEKLSSLGGESSVKKQKEAVAPEQVGLESEIEQAATLEDLTAILEKSGSIAGSLGRKYPAAEVIGYINELKSAKEGGILLNSDLGERMLRRITRDHGLRAKVLELLADSEKE